MCKFYKKLADGKQLIADNEKELQEYSSRMSGSFSKDKQQPTTNGAGLTKHSSALLRSKAKENMKCPHCKRMIGHTRTSSKDSLINKRCCLLPFSSSPHKIARLPK
jgi:hypothetical protein